MGINFWFSQSHYESGDETQYRLTCPYCGGTRFVSDKRDEDEWMERPMHEVGDEVTCAECSRTFTITGNSFKPEIE